MADLRSFLKQLESKLQEVDEPVDPVTQAGFLCSESDHPILLNNLKGFPDWKLADILVSTRDTQAIALGTTPENVVQHLASKIYGIGPGETKLVDDGPCKEVKHLGDDVDIRTLPIPIHSSGDGGDLGGRYLGSGLTVTKDPDTGVQNQAIIRTHIRDKDPRKVGFWMAARHNWAHYKKYESRGEKMPMAYAIGTHPAYEIMANYSGPHDGYDEFALGAGVLGETLELVKCETVDLEVPAHAELVIEGLVPPGVREPEGPFGEFTGFQGGKIGSSPVMEVTAITHRRNPIFRHMQATVYTDHQRLVALPMEAAIYRRVSDVQGGVAIHDVYVPPRAALFTAIIQMTAQWDGQAAAVGLAALSGVNLHPKIIVLVDEDVDPYDAEDVMWAITQRVNPQTDVTILNNQRIHPLDQSVPLIGNDVTVMRFGGKMVIDATKPPAWRPKGRATFTRVNAMGFDDPSIGKALAQIRERNA
jgi:2,5-furandicarboxylate decarboxylase 1